MSGFGRSHFGPFSDSIFLPSGKVTQPPRTKCFCSHAAASSGNADVEGNFAGDPTTEIDMPFWSTVLVNPFLDNAGGDSISTAHLSVLQVLTSMNAYEWGF